MVLEDFTIIHSKNSHHKQSLNMAPVLDRFLSFVFDCLFAFPFFYLLFSFLIKKVSKLLIYSPDSPEIYIFVLLGLFWALSLHVFISAFFLSRWGATPGMLIWHLRVVNQNQDSDEYKKPSMVQGVIRTLIFWQEIFCFGIPFLEIVREKNRIALHDRISKTIIYSLKNNKEFGPHELETKFVNSFYMFFGFSLFAWLIMMSSVIYQSASQGTYSLDKNADDDLLCKRVSHNLPKEKTRIDRAIALYFAGQIDDSCLEAEADHVLWQQDQIDKSWGYWAKLLSNRFSSSAEDYYKQLCNDKNSIGCRSMQSFTEKSVSNFIKNLGENPPESALAFLSQWWVNQLEYDKALGWANQLEENSVYGSFKTEIQIKSLLVKNKTSEAKAYYQAYYNLTDTIDRSDLSSWVCTRSYKIDEYGACSNLEREIVLAPELKSSLGVSTSLLLYRGERKAYQKNIQDMVWWNEDLDWKKLVDLVANKNNLSQEHFNQKMKEFVLSKSANKQIREFALKVSNQRSDRLPASVETTKSLLIEKKEE